MNTVKINSLNTKMVAHRGMSGLETENSLPAFVAAGNRSYYGIECDIHVTKDGRIVVIHDTDTGRVALENINIENSTFDEIRAIKLKNMTKLSPESNTSRGDLIIPTLTEYVSICKKYDKKCVIELKNEFEMKYIEQTVDKIKALDYLDEVIFISFSFNNMVKIRELLPYQSAQFLTCKFDEELIKNLDRYNLDLDIHHVDVTKDQVDTVHAHGHKINCWTVDDKSRAEALAEMGVDFITSNILE